PDERVRRGEVREELLEAALPPRPEYGIEVSRGVDALRHEGVDEVVAARLLPCELEEQVGEPIVRLRLLELGPVVELRVRQGKERLRVQDRKTIRLLAQLRLTLVEPHRGPLLLPELDHVTELVRHDRAEIARPGTGGERVDVDHLALRGEFVHPERELVGGAEIARGGTRDLREQDVDVRIGVDAGGPLRTVEPAVRRVDLVLERRRTRSELIDVDLDVVLHPPLRV